ncbi:MULTISPECIES: hypothetical protein [unclassified Rhizobium]|nr:MULTISPECIES: hypothetical protein [unclassified Rhizobium]
MFSPAVAWTMIVDHIVLLDGWRSAVSAAVTLTHKIVAAMFSQSA